MFPSADFVFLLLVFVCLFLYYFRTHQSASSVAKMDRTNTKYAKEVCEAFTAGACFAFQRIKLAREAPATADAADAAGGGGAAEDIRTTSLLEFTDNTEVSTPVETDMEAEGEEGEEAATAKGAPVKAKRSRKRKQVIEDDSDQEADNPGQDHHQSKHPRSESSDDDDLDVDFDIESPHSVEDAAGGVDALEVESFHETG